MVRPERKHARALRWPPVVVNPAEETNTMRLTVAPGTRVERLAAHLLADTPDSPFAEELVAWLAASGRFRAWADVHRDKIRKKLRTAAGTDARLDARAELAVAHRLVEDRHVELAWEAYGAQRGGPDFTIVYRRTQRFNLEVTRLRRQPDETVVASALLVKLRQLPPSVPNAVLLAVDAAHATGAAIEAALRGLRARADAHDDDFFTARGHAGTKEFNERWLRLGAVYAWAERATGPRATMTVNRGARLALPEKGARAVLRALDAPD
jgi:hypothetical protein